jgi:XTP/dITP diphosphohydrolase
MQELVIASNNKGKILEIRSMIDNIILLSLSDIGYTKEIPEPYDMFEMNAHAKAFTLFQYTGKNVFADDSGICVNALDGKPGVFSARYAGEGATDEANLHKLLYEIKDKEDRTAYYKAVICLLWSNDVHYFEGTCHGTIIDTPRGIGGFGYDPVFVPDGYDQTFAELPLDIKNTLSHRGIAVKKMVDFINEELKRG